MRKRAREMGREKATLYTYFMNIVVNTTKTDQCMLPLVPFVKNKPFPIYVPKPSSYPEPPQPTP